jgi:hypothetical protein
MSRKFTLFIVCAFEIILIFSIAFSSANSSEQKLNKFEQKKYAETCFDTVQGAFGNYFDVTDGYSYFEPDIERIHAGGADLSAVIKLTRIEKTGGNNGWGVEVSKKTFQYFECVFYSVPKGKYPEPVFFLQYYAKNSVDRWVVVHYPGRGAGTYRKCDPNEFGCHNKSRTWTELSFAPDGNQSFWRKAAKQRAPKRWIWEKSFVAE